MLETSTLAPDLGKQSNATDAPSLCQDCASLTARLRPIHTSDFSCPAQTKLGQESRWRARLACASASLLTVPCCQAERMQERTSVVDQISQATRRIAGGSVWGTERHAPARNKARVCYRAQTPRASEPNARLLCQRNSAKQDVRSRKLTTADVRFCNISSGPLSELF